MNKISYKFNFIKDRVVSCTVTNRKTKECKTIPVVWPPTLVVRNAHAALNLDLPEDLK